MHIYAQEQTKKKEHIIKCYYSIDFRLHNMRDYMRKVKKRAICSKGGESGDNRREDKFRH